MKKLRKCRVCGSYSMAETHCKERTLSGHPPPYDPNDKFGDYRRRWKGLR